MSADRMPDRMPGRKRHRVTGAGFSLIELMVGVSILAVLLALALPSFSEWIRNNQVRMMAESLREGLQLARSEAIKRNTRVRVQLVTTLDATCALSTTGPYWVANGDASVTPAGNCGAAPSLTTAPKIVQASPVTSAASKVTVAASKPSATSTGVAVVVFDAAGRQAAATNPTSAPGLFSVDVKSATGTCLVNGGDVRCLRVVVTTSGEVRMCDPKPTAITDPTRCY